MKSLTKHEPPYLNLYFQVHQPKRLAKFHFFDVGSGRSYFDDKSNREILLRIAEQCYLPANELLLKLIRKFPGFRVTFSISGVAMEQFQEYAPSVIKSFRRLAHTGAVEFLAETYYHSLSYFIDREEFIAQMLLHRQKLYELTGFHAEIARNTELVYSDDIGSTLADLNFRGVYIDGIQQVLGGRSPNAVYRHPTADLALFPRNFRLSDDIAFRYSDKNWNEWPLTGEKFASWLHRQGPEEKLVCLGMDYETFGEHKKADSGIFDFLRDLVASVARTGSLTFATPSEVINALSPNETVTTTKAISWADEARDLSAWIGNNMQRDAFDSLYKFHSSIVESENAELIEAYRHLQTSDHFYYMSTKDGCDGNVHRYFSPYASPYEAFMNYMNVVADIELRLKRETRVRNSRGVDARLEIPSTLRVSSKTWQPG